MIEEAYVSFEVAKLLNEKGFNEPILAYAYGQDMVSYYSRPRVTDPMSIEAGRIPLPTQQMAMRWLREKYELFIHIGNDDLDYWWQIEDVVNKDENYNPICKSNSYGGHSTYEEAVDAAIKYCLEHII